MDEDGGLGCGEVWVDDSLGVLRSLRTRFDGEHWLEVVRLVLS